jgi:hypothetical protein
MQSERLQLKLFLRPEHPIEVGALVRVFQRWIREKVLSEFVIDVVDYSHVKDGPGVVLIGHGSDYYLDEGEGRVGLVYSRKRQGPAPEARLEDGLRRLFYAAARLEQEPLEQPLRFRTDELLVRATDRLRAPNTDEGFSALRSELGSVLGKLYAGSSLAIERGAAAPAPLSARVTASEAPTLGALLERLGGPPRD